MSSTTLATSFLHLKTPYFNPPTSHPRFKTSTISIAPSLTLIKASSKISNHNTSNNNNINNQPIIQNLKNLASAAVLFGAAASMAAGKFSALPAKAETPATTLEELGNQTEQSSPLSEFLESNTEAISSLKSLLQEKLENGQDEEALKILNGLISAQPTVIEWKFLTARLLNEMGQAQNARKVFEEILAVNPLSFEALFENALLMDRCGEGEAVIRRLEEALEIAKEENKVKEARDVRLIMAQIQFLQKNVEEALKSYHELSKEDPGDFRPYFCRGMIYSLLDRNEEAREQFAKYRELSPKKFEVEGYIRTPLSRMKMFGSNEDN